jgi:hypothetical protein
MLGITHPLSGLLYEQDGQGNIKVSDSTKWGLFRTDGKWISGEIFECDPQMCGWVGGPKFVNYRLDTSFDKR